MAGKPVEDDTVYSVATVEILAKGGDLYRQFTRAQEVTLLDDTFSDLLERYFSDVVAVQMPQRGRLLSR
jgi:hypothetical protein